MLKLSHLTAALCLIFFAVFVAPTAQAQDSSGGENGTSAQTDSAPNKGDADYEDYKSPPPPEASSAKSKLDALLQDKSIAAPQSKNSAAGAQSRSSDAAPTSTAPKHPPREMPF